MKKAALLLILFGSIWFNTKAQNGVVLVSIFTDVLAKTEYAFVVYPNGTSTSINMTYGNSKQNVEKNIIELSKIINDITSKGYLLISPGTNVIGIHYNPTTPGGVSIRTYAFAET